jgi:hypothetical protein
MPAREDDVTEENDRDLILGAQVIAADQSRPQSDIARVSRQVSSRINVFRFN